MALKGDINFVPDSAESSSSRFAYLHKNADKTLSQERRRELFLLALKEKRYSAIDAARHLDVSSDDDDFACETIDNEEPMLFDEEPPKTSPRFRLMESEWLREVPQDLKENWLVKFVPDGFRVLLIAKKNRTILYNIRRHKVLTFKTHLWGGGFANLRHSMTILDCIYHMPTKTIFILDCLFWNNTPLIDTETSFRFYWLKNQFAENDTLTEASLDHKLCLMDFFAAEKPIIQDQMFQDLLIDNKKVILNGILFYHKELHYVYEQTPLMCWLFSYMLVEKLHIDVPDELLGRRPDNYVNLEEYLIWREKQRQEKRDTRNRVRDFNVDMKEDITS